MGEMTKQLKAIIATRERVEEEARRGRKYHNWSEFCCPLCALSWGCRGCPFYQLEPNHCKDFCQDNFGIENNEHTPIEYILSFLIDLEDCYRRMEK